MKKNRLLKLALFLEFNVPEHNFDMESWTCPSDSIEDQEGEDNYADMIFEDLIEHNCGTTACALGWASVMPEFKAKGLHLDDRGTPTFKSFQEFEAGENFFDLTYDQAYYLFSGNYGDETPQEVAARIRQLVFNGEMN